MSSSATGPTDLGGQTPLQQHQHQQPLQHEGYNIADQMEVRAASQSNGQGEHGDDDDDNDEQRLPCRLPRSLTLRLYTSHFLSTWNSRVFEFGAVLFLANIFPSTLLYMSVYALVRSASAILFAQSIGSWIDRGNRLTVVRVSIIGQRLAVAVSCAVLWLMERKAGSHTYSVMQGQFALVVLLACVEKLCSVMNLVSIERDWVVVMTEGNEVVRQDLNARMRRIDLLCKLLGPLVISSIAAASTIIAIWATLGMNIVSVLFEYVFIAQVYNRTPALKRTPPALMSEDQRPNTDGHNTHAVQTWLKSMKANLLPLGSLPFYFHQPAFLPSFSLSLLYLTVLSFSGQMITYLISIGYTNLQVGLARTVSTMFELSATWIAPRMMKRVGLVRGGIWSLSWQMIWLAGAVSWLFSDFHGAGTNSIMAGSGLVVGVGLSRVGLWGYDLCAQAIVQNEVDANHRGTFSTVEAAFQNLFEMFSYVTTIVFSDPKQFQWPVVISVVAVYMAGGEVTYFMCHAVAVKSRKTAEMEVTPSIIKYLSTMHQR
ncbi:hypothetical protein PFICI_14168 [Pestalotiopsis fici W106-1]|uniref:Solute carrier family 40 member n=1 Tax=Pestalotiopsis fici (strain W106-1 / CGMCC3.15140) TaxID=1229662 RepID=W3WMD5_PESFW|nr:uncharacterized protein PFICI_14168 [Pestalotiopsis fici W106-1]ETS74302.1 hypothetical protein PFICI_14168 [Pestalotiopsis fici W106-1]